MSRVINNRYAGDAAWEAWFRICSVAGCDAETAKKLREQVESAMHAQLVRAGLRPEDAAGDDPVAFFDSYFKLKGSREKPKPLKAYFAYRIEKEGLALRDFVCGTLFGSLSGRIHDIVTSTGGDRAVRRRGRRATSADVARVHADVRSCRKERE